MINENKLTFKENFFFEKVFLTLLFCYFFLLWIGEYFYRRDYSDPLDLFFLFSHGIFFFLSAIFLKGEWTRYSLKKISLKEILCPIFVIATYCVVLYVKFSEKVIWLDEHIQFIFGSHFVSSNVIQRAINQQQPPLDYMLMGYAKSYFGNTVFAVKFHAMVFGGATLIYIPRLIKAYWPTFINRYVVSLIFLFSPFFLSYCLEGRPISLTLFAATNFMLFLRGYTKEKCHIGWLLLSTLFLLSATSLQPQIFIFCAFMITTLLYWKKFKCKLILLGGAVALWRLPIDYRIFLSSRDQRVFVEEGKNIISVLSNIYERVVFTISQHTEWQVTLLVISIILSLYLIIKKDKKSLFLILFFISFFGLYSVIWDFSVNSVLNPRYMICGQVLLFLLVGNFIYQLEQKFRAYKLTVSVIVFFLVSVFGVYFINRPLAEYSKASVRPAWNRAYEFLNNIVDEDDVVMHIAFAGLTDFKGQGHIGSLFYGNELVNKSLLKYKKNYDWLSPNHIYFDEERDYLKPNDMVILLLNRNEQEPRFIRYHYAGLSEFYYFYGIEVLIFKKEGNLYQSMKAVFEEFIRTYGAVEKTMPFLEALIYMENKYGSKRGLRHYIDLYKSIKFDSDLNHRGFIIDKKGEHQKRIQTFEKFYSTWSKR